MTDELTTPDVDWAATFPNEDMSPLPDLVREEEYSIAFLAGKVDALTKQVELLTAQQEGISKMLATVVEQVGPTIDSLSSHPMFKMMFGGK